MTENKEQPDSGKTAESGTDISQITAQCTKDIAVVLDRHGCKLVADAIVRGNQFEVVGTRVQVVIQ